MSLKFNHRHLRLITDQPATLSVETISAVFEYLAQEFEVEYRKPQHRNILQTRTYENIKQIETALRHYKVFGDLAR